MTEAVTARSIPLRIAALVMAGAIVVGGCVAAGSPSPSGPAGSATPALAGSNGASPMMPGPSGPAASMLESMAPGSTPAAALPTPAAGASGGHKGNDLIECIGLQQGPPCVPASESLYVITAEKALPQADAASITSAVFEPVSGACPPTGAIAACSGSNAGLGTVTFGLKNGSQVRVFVYQLANGSLAGVLLG